jgi:hypothetical protein
MMTAGVRHISLTGVLCTWTASTYRASVRKDRGNILQPLPHWCACLTSQVVWISVDIAFPTRSQFLEACEAAIRDHRAELLMGATVQVGLPEGGYDGQVIVTIDSTDRAGFGTDWESADPTRFPARIRAAAAALFNCHCDGRFEVSHSEGSMTIRAI